MADLSIRDDPLSTLVERCMIARPESPRELEGLLRNPRLGTVPSVTAYPGFTGIGAEFAYYRDVGTGDWVHVLTGELWPGR